MKEIFLEAIEIINFKGLTRFNANFTHNTIIQGDNATHKTTIYDAYTWCLFGSSSLGNADFKVQPLDSNGNTIPKINTSVIIKLKVNGKDIIFKKELTQNWVVPRGCNDAMLKGNTITYFINEVPCKQSEYNATISEIGDISVLKILSGVYAFNELTMQERRKALQQIAPAFSEIDIAKPYPAVFEALRAGKTIEQYQSEISAKIKKIREQLDFIPTRIDEQTKSIYKDINFSEIRTKALELEQTILDIDTQLFDFNKSIEKHQAQRDELSEINSAIEDYITKRNIKKNENIRDAENRKITLTNAKSDIIKKLANFKKSVAEIETYLQTYEVKKGGLRQMWIDENNKPFDNSQNNICPLCKREYEADKLAQMESEAREMFNQAKRIQLNKIEDEAKAIQNSINAENANLKQNIAAIETGKNELAKVEEQLIDANRTLNRIITSYSGEIQNPTYLELIKQQQECIRVLKSDINNTNNSSGLIERKKTLQSELKTLQSELIKEQRNNEIKERINELEANSKQLAAEIASYNKVMHQIGQFKKDRITFVENNVSSLFELATFKMYEPNITNDGEKEICECLYNGVPYNGNLNQGARINVGIDIINGFSKAHNIVMPIFIDNAESVTQIEPTKAQTIKLEKVAYQELTII